MADQIQTVPMYGDINDFAIGGAPVERAEDGAFLVPVESVGLARECFGLSDQPPPEPALGDDGEPLPAEPKVEEPSPLLAALRGRRRA